MTLIVETGAGLSGAESYLSVADFKLYSLANYAVTDPVSDEAVEQALRRATRYIDGRYRARFAGYRTLAYSQALEWPREGVMLNWLPESGYYHLYGYNSGATLLLANNIVPQQLKDAVAEAAVRELASPNSLTPDRKPSGQVLVQTVGPISTTYANVPDTRPIVTVIDEILSPLLSRRSALSGIALKA